MKHIKPILFGLLAVLAVNMLYIIVTLMVQSSLPSTLNRHNPFFTVGSWMLYVKFYLAPFIGGFAAGSYAKHRSWLYGLLIGTILVIISVILAFLFTFTLSPAFSSHDLWPFISKYLKRVLMDAPMIMLLTTIGGALGQLTYEKT